MKHLPISLSMLTIGLTIGLSGCSQKVERPEAMGLLSEPKPYDRRAERDTRMAVLHAVHPEPLRPDPVFMADTPSDLLADDLRQLEALLAQGNRAAALELTRTLIQRVRGIHEREERAFAEAAERRDGLLSMTGTP